MKIRRFDFRDCRQFGDYSRTDGERYISPQFRGDYMDDVLNVGDTICCHDYADMMDVMNELMKQGYIVTAQVGYVVRIESVPLADPTEQDGWVTWNK
jgi:hypothetical protein